MKTTEIRKNKCDEYIRATYGINESGNYFSITGDILNKDGKVIGGGCIHERIKDVFPELAPLIPFHLVYTDGRPTHYISNAIYWAELACGVSKWYDKRTTNLDQQDFVNILTNHILANVLNDEEELGSRLRMFAFHYPKSKEKVVELFAQWLENRIPALKQAFDKTIGTSNES